MILEIPKNIIIDTSDSYNNIIYQSGNHILIPYLNNRVFESFDFNFRERNYIFYSVLIFQDVFSLEFNCKKKELETVVINENNFFKSQNEEYISALDCEIKLIFDQQLFFFNNNSKTDSMYFSTDNIDTFLKTLPIDLINELNLTEIKILAQL